MGQPRPLFCLFSVFFKQTLQFLQYVKKCPSSIRCRDSNPQPSECESLPITTRPGLPPQKYIILMLFAVCAYEPLLNWSLIGVSIGVHGPIASVTRLGNF